MHNRTIVLLQNKLYIPELGKDCTKQLRRSQFAEYEDRERSFVRLRLCYARSNLINFFLISHIRELVPYGDLNMESLRVCKNIRLESKGYPLTSRISSRALSRHPTVNCFSIEEINEWIVKIITCNCNDNNSKGHFHNGCQVVKNGCLAGQSIADWLFHKDTHLESLAHEQLHLFDNDGQVVDAKTLHHLHGHVARGVSYLIRAWNHQRAQLQHNSKESDSWPHRNQITKKKIAINLFKWYRMLVQTRVRIGSSYLPAALLTVSLLPVLQVLV